MSPAQLDPKECEAIEREIAKYPPEQRQAAVIAALHIVQRSRGGWLKPEALEAVANTLEMPLARVHEVASFYSLYFLHNCGRVQVDLCTNVSCMLKGAAEVLSALKKALPEQQESGKPSDLHLREVECLGACVHAPVMQIGDHYHERLTPESAVAVVQQQQEKMRNEP